VSRWSLHCDRPGCTAAVSPRAHLVELYAYAEAQGWQVEPAIAPLRHFCPAHHVVECDCDLTAAVGIRRAP
jgi:hypothetical protein